jgi:FdhE protein
MPSYSSKIKSLQDAALRSPEYVSIVPLFVELFRYLDSTVGQTGIVVDARQEFSAINLANGFPLIAPEHLTIDSSVCSEFLKGAIAVLSQVSNEGADDLTKIQDAINAGMLDLKTIFSSILERKRSAIDEAALAINVPAPLLEFIFEIPLKSALELFAEGIPADGSENWTEGFCPVCGSRAGMAELAGEEGKRYLCCSACTFRWPFKRLQCPYCENGEVEKLSYFVAGDGATRVDTCKACSRYIKTRDSRKGNADVPMDVEDLLTIHLDLLASKEGFERGK